MHDPLAWPDQRLKRKPTPDACPPEHASRQNLTFLQNGSRNSSTTPCPELHLVSNMSKDEYKRLEKRPAHSSSRPAQLILHHHMEGPANTAP